MPKFKEGDVVAIKSNFGDYVCDEDPLTDSVEKVKKATFRITKVYEYTDACWYDVLAEGVEDENETFEIEEVDLKKVRVRPPTKSEMDYVLKSLGVG